MQADASIKSSKLSSLADEKQRLQTVDNFLRVITDYSIEVSTLKTIDEIVWSIVNHAIAKLDFEECVVYLVDPVKNLLIQKAAYGPKNPEDKVILNLLEIPVGTGIVGAAAQTKVPLCVIDTRNEPRYIVDDACRLSELAVPIVFEDRVLGVIDSEHSEVGFFTSHHQKLMQTVAALTAPRIAFLQSREISHEQAHKIASLSGRLSCLSNANAQLAQTTNILRDISREKSDLLQQVNGQLRTALTSILGLSELLLEKIAESAEPADLRDDLKSIEAAGLELKQSLDHFSELADALREQPTIVSPSPQ